jgi:type II secretory pathway pseudopilin PulG
VTLIELLVVITVILMLLALVARLMSPAIDNRRVREAARAVNVYLSSARNTAMVTGRPCGVVILPTSAWPEEALTLKQVEVPPPYAGDDQLAALQIQNQGNGYFLAQVPPPTPTLSPTLTFSSPNTTLVHAGDTIQFNNQGPWYTIQPQPLTSTNVNVSLPFTLALTDSTQTQPLPWPAAPLWSAPVSYRIYRLPYAVGLTSLNSIATPLQLPAGSVVDMTGSSIDGPNTFYGHGPVFIMFSPSGAVDRVYCATYAGVTFNGPVTPPIFLLVGSSWNSGEVSAASFYVVINPRTGLVTTAPAVYGQVYLSAGNDSRKLARQAVQQGGW